MLGGEPMELRHLRYFVAVAEEENVTRAAARLHVAQPALSRQVRDLEEAVGVVLFERQARALRLTEAGRLFLDEARKVLAQVEVALQTVREFAHGQRGELHVGYAPSLTTEILPRALRLFYEACPRVQVRLHDLSTEEMLAGLRAGQLQAALLARSSRAGLEGLVFREVARLPMAVAMAQGHPLCRKKKLTPAAFAGLPYVAYSRAEYPEYHAMLEQAFRKTRPAPVLAAEFDSSTALIAAVEAGAGFAIVQESFSNLSGNRLIIRPLESAQAVIFFGIAWRKDDTAVSTARFVAAVG